jgi:hypothetical protein
VTYDLAQMLLLMLAVVSLGQIRQELRKMNKGFESDRSGEGDRTIRYPLK